MSSVYIEAYDRLAAELEFEEFLALLLMRASDLLNVLLVVMALTQAISIGASSAQLIGTLHD